MLIINCRINFVVCECTLGVAFAGPSVLLISPGSHARSTDKVANRSTEVIRGYDTKAKAGRSRAPDHPHSA